HLYNRTRRKKAPLPGAHIQRRPGAVFRNRETRTRSYGGEGPHGAPLFLRLGHPHGGARRDALQSDVISQRLDLAARQFIDRDRTPTLWVYRRGRSHIRRNAARCLLHGIPAPARTLLWISPASQSWAHALPGCMLAPGMVGGHTLCAAGDVARTGIRRRGQGDPIAKPASATVYRRTDNQGIAARRFGRPPLPPWATRRHISAPAAQ